MRGGFKIRKTITVGIIGFILLSSFGLLTADSWSEYLNFEASNKLRPQELRLRDVAENPESYLGETISVEGHTIFLQCSTDSQCFNEAGDFLLVESTGNPGDIWIWVSIIDKTIPLPPSDAKVLITGEIAHVKDPEELYRIEAQKIDVLNTPMIPPFNSLELFTDKNSYELGEEIILTFTNHGPDAPVTLPNGAPFSIEYNDPESGTISLYSPMAIQVLIPVPAGESMTWNLTDSPGIKGAGYYMITFQVYVDESFETLETLYTKFTIGIQPNPYDLDLFTDKATYRLGEEVVLTFVNNGPEGTEAILLNGNPFEIEFQDLETEEVTVYTLPTIEILIIVPAGEKITWTLSEEQGLMGAGYYSVAFQVTVNEQVEHLSTKFSVVASSNPPQPQLVFYPNKFMYELGEEVNLTFVNLGSGEKEVILPNGFPIEIEYRDLDTGEVRIYSLPATEAEVPVLEGDSIEWTLTDDRGLEGAGYYALTLRVYVNENSETLYTKFFYGLPPSASELFTDKELYKDGENITLTFINREPSTVNAGYCLDITYQVQESSPRIPLYLACIEILVFLPPEENITWTFTPSELMGPGHYTVNYRVFSEEDGRQLAFQTEFEIVPETIPKTSTETTPIDPENGMFVPGFELGISIIGILSVLLVRPRKRNKNS